MKMALMNARLDLARDLASSGADTFFDPDVSIRADYFTYLLTADVSRLDGSLSSCIPFSDLSGSLIR